METLRFIKLSKIAVCEQCAYKQHIIRHIHIANGSPSSGATNTPKPTSSLSESTKAPTSSSTTQSPTTSIIKATPQPTDSAIVIIETMEPTQSEDTHSPTTTFQPTIAIIHTTVIKETTTSPQDKPQVTTNAPTQSPNAQTTDYSYDYDYGNYYGLISETNATTQSKKDDSVILDSNGMLFDTPHIRITVEQTEEEDTPATTDIYDMDPASHPFANLLLVSLIILGFCVFVAWYAKKNQISDNRMNGNDDDNGYLWGLNKASSSESNMMSKTNAIRDIKSLFSIMEWTLK